MKKVSLFLICFIFLSQFFAQGIKFDEAKYNAAPSYEPQKQQGFSTASLPSRISFRAYCPPVQSQGQLSTCVGWATSYALLSTQQNILMGETDEYRKTIRAMDPNFVYAMIRDYSDSWCQNGTSMVDAMDVLLEYGSKPLVTPPWLSCNSTTKFDNFCLAVASNYSLSNYYTLQDKTDLINTIKYTLYNNHPLAVGMNLTNSFYTGKGVKYGKWTSSSTEQIAGGHAMCIIGYDDSKYGGCFELLNSYGTSFGENGYVWITYADMKKYMAEAYIIELNTESNGYRTGSCTYGDCYSNFSRYKYSSGDVYEGQFTKGYRDGWGMLLEPDGGLYMGGFTNGYKNGWSVFYSPKNGAYYKLNYSYGTLKSYDVYQGFSGTEEDKKLDGLIQKMQAVLPGKVAEEGSDAYQQLVDSSKPEEEPVMADPKLPSPPVIQEKPKGKKGRN